MNDDVRARRDARRLRWIVRIGPWIIRALAATWRVRVIGYDEAAKHRANGGAVIFTLWHGQMLPLLWQHRKQDVAILISEHRDGEIIAQIAERLGYRTVRGSTSRGAGRALIEMTRVLEAGGDVAVTPDGPRGPARSFAPGALAASARSGAPLLCIVADAKRAWHLRTWDAFTIPKPFTRVTIAYELVSLATRDVRAAAEDAPRLTTVLTDLEARARAANA